MRSLRISLVGVLGATGLLGATIGLGFATDAGATPAPTRSADAPAPREHVPGEVLVQREGEPHERVVELPAGVGVREAVRELRQREDVRWATPNAIARASVIPRDPGRAGVPRGWQRDQWNFLPPPPVGTACTPADPCGVNAPRAWDLLKASGHKEGRRRKGKRGPIVAVIDTGVAYRSRGRRHRRNPDFSKRAFVRGWDFIGDNRRPLDKNGHGTHVAATIIERAGNRKAVTGLGDQLRVMPIRVLNADGAGTANDVARGIRLATRRGADVINLSLEFGPGFGACAGLRGVCGAIFKAQSSGILVVAATGNAGADTAQMPGKVSMAVAASTIRGCLSEFSSRGPGTDITAPGGGFDAPDAGSHCDPLAAGPGIVQLTLRPRAVDRRNYRRFGYPRYEGTSMSTPHVSAAAALVLSSRVLARKVGGRPTPNQLERWLECTARSPFDESAKSLYGAGLLDLAAALDPASSCPGLG
jgi:serine protease